MSLPIRQPDPAPSAQERAIKFSVGHKLAAIFFAFFLLTAGSLILVETLYNGVADASRLVNESGKLRYLSQRMAFYATESALKKRPNDAIPALTQRFEATLAEVERESASLHPLLLQESGALATQLKDVHGSWLTFRNTMDKILTASSPGRNSDDTSQLIRDTDSILEHADRVVSTLTAAAQRAHRHIDWLIAGVAALNLAFLGTLFAYARWRIVNPLVAVTEVVKRFAAGDRSIRLHASGGDEIGDLIQSFNQSAEQVDDYIGQISRLAEILEATPDFVGTATPDGKVLYVNRAAREILGFGPDDNIVGKHIGSLHPEWAYRLVEQEGIPTAIREGYWRGENALLSRDGKEIPISQVILAHKTPDGRLAYLSAIMRDISERVAMEERLTRSRDLYLKLLHDFPQPVWRSGVDGKLDFFNRAWLDFTGRSLQQEQGEGWAEGVHPEDLARCQQIYHDAFQARQPFAIEFRHRRHDGAFRWVIGHGAPFRDMDDNFAGYIGSTMDITERRQAELELRQLSQAVDQSANSILITDIEGTIEYVNPYFSAVTGYTRNEVIGRKPSLWKSQHTPPDEYRALWQTILSGQTWHGEMLNLKKDGTPFWEAATISPVKNERGEITNFVGIKQDITDRKQAEEQLRLWGRAIEASVNAITITDATLPDQPYVYVNPAFEHMTGYSAAEARGQNGRFLQGGDSDQPDLEQIRLALREQREGKAVLRNYRKDGSMFWNELIVAPVKGEGGRVTHYIGIQNDITERKQYEEQLAYQASHDALTRLPNRNLAQDRLAQGIIFAQRNQRLLALMFIDLDNFKFINDSLGHETGDQLLQIVASRLGDSIRAGDTVARLGGDEFLVILTDVGREEDISQVAHKILTTVAEQVSVGKHDLLVTCSIGVSIYPRDGENPQTLLKNADAAMYRAKEQGRNGIQYYTAEMNTRAFQRLMLENGLRSALESQEFELHYQPQVSLHSGKIVGMEALLRWHHPELGMISPASFIPLAEDTGLIVPIGEWVLHTACRQIKAWQDAGLPPLRVAVNLSARQLRQNIPALVGKALTETGLKPEYLELEITESVAMQHAEASVQTFVTLREMGVRLSIDDFGTGYSSLSYLKRFPINKLKLDQSFVRDIISDPDDAAISETIIALAHSLKLEVIAEGVETESQLNFLQRRDCDAIQGYYFSRPIPAAEVERMLREERSLAIPREPGKPARTLLLLDDEPNVLSALQRTLHREGYRILATTRPAEAFELLAQNHVGVIVSDQRMPDMSGTEFLGRVRELYPDTVRIVLSGYAELSSVMDAINRGAIYKFFTKPWEDEKLRAHIADAFRYQEMNGGNGRSKPTQPGI